MSQNSCSLQCYLSREKLSNELNLFSGTAPCKDICTNLWECMELELSIPTTMDVAIDELIYLSVLAKFK